MEQPIEKYVAKIQAQGMVAPERAVAVRRLCLCVLVHSNERIVDDEVVVREAKDSCAVWFTDPDSPLCPDCVAAGHEDLPHVSYVEVERLRAKP